MRIASWLAASFLFLTCCTSSRAELIYGLTNLQQLVTFDSVARSVTATASLPFTVGGEIIVSIDVRPATSELYGLSSLNNLYRIVPATGASTAVGPGLGAAALTGNVKSIDFNPTVDRIRVISTNDQNLRVHPDTGLIAFTDGNLAFAAADANAGDNPSSVNAAYTNSLPGAVSTVLYEVEAGNNILVTQTPPNDGILNTVGALGFDVVDSSGFTGFDISGSSGTAYLTGNSLLGGGLAVNSLYTVNLATGAATLAGPVSGINGSFRDIAVAAVPEPSGLLLVGLGFVAVGYAQRRRLHSRSSRVTC